jgi:hypothetical protein
VSGQTFPAGGRPTGAQLTAIQYNNRTGVSNQSVTAGTDTTTSATYANLAGTGSTTSFSFTKVLTSTNLFVTVHAGFLAATNSAICRFGVLVNGVDNDCGQDIQAAGDYIGVSGFAIISGLSAGTYTIQGRWRRVGGTGTCTRDTNTWYALEAAETT